MMKALKGVPVLNAVVNKGSVRLSFQNEDQLKEANDVLPPALGQQVQMVTETKALLDPRISIGDLGQDLLDKETLISEITSGKNEEIKKLVDEGGKVKVVHLNPTGRIAVLQVSPEIRNVIARKGDKGCRKLRQYWVRDRYHVVQCFHCQEFGHVAGSIRCTKKDGDAVCAFCAGNHETRSCGHKTRNDTGKINCANCQKSNGREDRRHARSHLASSTLCPFFINERTKLMERTNLTNFKKHDTVSLLIVQFNLGLPSYSPPPYRQLWWFREDVFCRRRSNLDGSLDESGGEVDDSSTKDDMMLNLEDESISKLNDNEGELEEPKPIKQLAQLKIFPQQSLDGQPNLTNFKKHDTVSLLIVQFNLGLPSYSPPPYRQLWWFREDVFCRRRSNLDGSLDESGGEVDDSSTKDDMMLNLEDESISKLNDNEGELEEPKPIKQLAQLKIFPQQSLDGQPSMANRNPEFGTRKSSKRFNKSARKFVIPTLLKTEQIMVEDIIKPEIDPPWTDSKSSEITGIADSTIYYTCGGCGESGFHHLGLEYRLVRTATLVEVGSQTGDTPEIQGKDSGMIGSEVGILDYARNNQHNPISVPTSSAASPILASSASKNGDTDEDCSDSDEEEYPGESGGEEEVSSSEDDMMLGVTYETLNEEEVQQSSFQKPNFTKSINKQPTTSNPDLHGTFAEKNRALAGPDGESLLYLSPGTEVGLAQNNRTSLAEDFTEGNVQKSDYKCKIMKCSVVKSSEKDLFEHVRVDHSDRKYRCDLCPIAFELNCHLNGHNRIHSADKRFQCDECGIKCTRKSDLKRHILCTHNFKKIVPCQRKHCGVRLPKNELFDHIRTAHPKEKFQCDVCPKSFKSSKNLREHARNHNGNKPYECEVCGKKFSYFSSYRRHFVVHAGMLPFKCDVCGKAFSREGDIRTHMRIHTGEKSYKCCFCEKLFAFPAGRSIHELSSNSFTNVSLMADLTKLSGVLGAPWGHIGEGISLGGGLPQKSQLPCFWPMRFLRFSGKFGNCSDLYLTAPSGERVF
eukprot:sb/3461544/